MGYDQALDYYEVDPETVGQFTGLVDLYDKKIFEGDIIAESYGGKECRRRKVEFSLDRCGWYPFACGDGCGCCEDEVVDLDFAIVLGNIHDNPELLGG